ncbi:MAG: histidinol-phosphate transaminase [Cellulosilyticaceae bacterium]
MNPYVKETFREVVPYKAIHRKSGIILDANENTQIPLKALREHMAKWMLEMPINRYPDSDTTKLRLAIANAHHVSPDHIVCGVGSDQLIDCLLRSVLNTGEVVVSPVPSFSMYALTAKTNGGRFEGVPLKEDFTYDFDKMYEAVVSLQPKVTFICNPNNPTGCILAPEQIETLVQAATGIVVVDEAYIEFGGESVIGLISKYTNLLVLRTFSKAYGLAGARVGYGIGSQEIIDAILISKPPYHLNRFSQEIATWVMTHAEAYREIINGVSAQREQVYEALKSYGYTVYPSAANFLWMKAEAGLMEKLEATNIFIKAFSYRDTAYYRISIGTEQENAQLLAICKGEQS